MNEQNKTLKLLMAVSRMRVTIQKLITIKCNESGCHVIAHGLKA